MRRALYVVSALVAATLIAPGTPAAHADVFTYHGGCGMNVANDTTEEGTLGGERQWNGIVYVAAVVVSSTGSPVNTTATVSCELMIDGISKGIQLTGSGRGIVASVGTFSFWAEDDPYSDPDVVLCTNVTVDWETSRSCGTATENPVLQEPFQSLLDQALLMRDEALDLAVDLLVDDIVVPLDPTLCYVLVALAPVVNGTGVAYIDPYAGDTYVNGDDLVWDCGPWYSGDDEDLKDELKEDQNQHHLHYRPDGGSGSADYPYFPPGSITISQSPGGPVTYDMTVNDWNCTPTAETQPSMSCTPPDYEYHYNVCGTVSVSVQSNDVGVVAGTSACAPGDVTQDDVATGDLPSADFATAQSVGPATTASYDSASPNADFPWTCAANPGASLDWTVTCTVN